MSTKVTFAPWAQKCSTRLSPMPEPPPVMKVTRSLRLGYSASFSVMKIHPSLFAEVRRCYDINLADGAIASMPTCP